MKDHKGRIDSSVEAARIFRGLLQSAEPTRALFKEAEVTFYWDRNFEKGDDKPINLLCAPRDEFTELANPHRFVCTWGADCAGWPDDNGFNSAGLFGQFITNSVLSELEKLEILLEFSRVEECQWAREMVYGYVRNHRLIDDQGYPIEIAILNQADIGTALAVLSDYIHNRQLMLAETD